MNTYTSKTYDDVKRSAGGREASYRRMSFTWWNYTSETIDHIKSMTSKDFDYVIVGHEICPDSGKKHLQGYVEFSFNTTFTQARKRFLKVIAKVGECDLWITPSYKCRLANIRYCMKEESGDPEYTPKFFEIEFKGKEQGRRKDCEAVFYKLVDQIEEGTDRAEIARQYPDLMVKHRGGVLGMIEDFKVAEAKQGWHDHYSSWRPWAWQSNLIEELSGPGDDRKIIWYVDKDGGCGKSSLADWCILNLDAEVFENGATKDLSHGWQCKKIAIFDFVRSNEEHINYDVIERVKNGKSFSTKYNSGMKYGHKKNFVVVFANHAPNMSKLSADRWDIRHLDKSGCVHGEHLAVGEPKQVCQAVIEDIEPGNWKTSSMMLFNMEEDNVADVSSDISSECDEYLKRLYDESYCFNGLDMI